MSEIRPSGTRTRPEVQALRAVAVAGVVLYHLWPPVITGGYVGVDVFFVISGFLITSHLMREAGRSGTIRLGGFWARRARRLLPASLLVLLVTAIGVLAWVPSVLRIQFFKETIASALYVENWVLAGDSVDYLAANNVPTAVQHYWSLSVEEQFYLIWPLLIILAFWIARRSGRMKSNRVAFVALVIVTAASLACSIVVTATNPAPAYFITPTRAWEFGAGGLLALAAVWFDGRWERVRPFVAWAGWLAIAYAVFRYTASTPFPGTAALIPVLGAVAVIWAGSPAQWWAPTAVVAWRPVQWVGDVSYSIYLWHWPLLIIAPYALGFAQLALPEKAGVLVATVVLAWLTKRFVEDPVRTGRLASRRPRWTFAAVVVAMLIVIVPAATGETIVHTNAVKDDAERAQLAASTCFGAASLDPAKDCSSASFPVISPDPAYAPQDSPSIYSASPPCFAAGEQVASCTIGDPRASVRVALVGDSHAAQWEPALERIAKERGWDLELFLKTNCAFTDAKRSARYDACAVWSDGVSQRLATERPFDLVITSFFADNLSVEVAAGSVRPTAAVKGFQSVWRPLIDRGATVVVLRDTPHMNQATTVCVATSGESPKCNVPRASATAQPDLEYQAAAGDPHVARIDQVDLFCTSDSCPAVIGGVAVHTDPYHMTKTYAATTTPYLLTSLKRAVSRVPGASAELVASFG